MAILVTIPNSELLFGHKGCHGDIFYVMKFWRMEKLKMIVKLTLLYSTLTVI